MFIFKRSLLGGGGNHFLHQTSFATSFFSLTLWRKNLPATIMHAVLRAEMVTAEDRAHFTGKKKLLEQHSGYLAPSELFSYQIDTLVSLRPHFLISRQSFHSSVQFSPVTHIRSLIITDDFIVFQDKMPDGVT